MSWRELIKNVPYLSTEIGNDINNDIRELASELTDKGYTIPEINIPIFPHWVGISEIRSQLKNGEACMDALNTDVVSIYYDGHNIIGKYFTLDMYNRWVDILNDLKNIILDGNRQWQQVTLTAESGEPDMQIDGQDVWIRGDAI